MARLTDGNTRSIGTHFLSYNPKAEYDKLLEQSRKWEGRAKSNAELLARMSGDSREEVEANADFIAERMAGASIYPSVSDGGSTAASPITREEIEAIRDPRERVRMRAKHIDLYGFGAVPF